MSITKDTQKKTFEKYSVSYYTIFLQVRAFRLKKLFIVPLPQREKL